MPVYIGDENNKAKEVKSIYVGNDNNIACRVIKAYVGDENNKAQLVYDDSVRDFTNLNFKCTNVNDATGGTVTVDRIYTAIPEMWNTGADLNTSAIFTSDKLKLRKDDIVKAIFTLSVPSACNNYNITMWLMSNDTTLQRKADNTKNGELTWPITSSLSPISIRINVYGDAANVRLTDCSIYVNDIKIL